MRLTLAALLLPVLAAASAADEPQAVTPRHTRVALFKNGLAMVETRVDLGELEAEREYRLTPLPPARLGSLWLGWSEGIAVDRVRSAWGLTESQAPANDLAGLLRTAVGQQVAVRIEGEWVEGELLSLPNRPLPPPSVAVSPSPRGPYGQYNRYESVSHVAPGTPALAAEAAGNLVLLRQPEGVIALPLSSITRVRVAEAPQGATVAVPTWTEGLQFRAQPTGGGSGGEVTLRYLAQGLAWSPSYVVELTGDDTARLSAKAVIANDFADLAGAEAELVAGFPHAPLTAIEEATTLMPLLAWLDQMRTATGRADPMANTAGSYLLRQRAEYAPAEPSVATIAVAPIPGEASEDLFFFSVDDLTVAKGERLYHPMFAAEVPYSHCYTWDIPDYVNEQRGYQDEIAEAEQVVWHALRLTNTTSHPWTTAAGMTMKGGRVLGQDTLHYTPPGAETDLRITQAVSIKAEQSEREIERQRNAARFYGSHYDQVTVEGELVLTNYRRDAVTVQVSKTLSGEVESADAEPKIVKLARGLRRVNPTSKLTWNVDVNPGSGSAARVTYRYTVYVRN